MDNSICVACGLCEKACPIIQTPPISERFEDCVVAQNADEKILDECTSGGFIDAVCRYVFEEKNGCAVGVTYDEEFMPKHHIAHSYQEASAFRNSKYA